MDIRKAGSTLIALRVARWGNSLAVRLPVDYIRRTHLADGDTLLLVEEPDGTLSLKPAPAFDRVAFMELLRRQHAKQRPGRSVVDQLRRSARY